MTRAWRVGTRGSPLASAQTEEVLGLLGRAFPDERFEKVVIRTHGDEGYRDLGTSLDGKRAFTKRIEDALLDGAIDLAVHSLKDLPSDLVGGLTIAAIPLRGDPRDVLVAADGRSLAHLPPLTRVGTSSLRRRAQLLAQWPGLEVVELHGNVGTRLRRLGSREFDAVVLAAAGLQRLRVTEWSAEPIPPEIVTPAPGQGALAVECRASDGEARALLVKIDDAMSRQAAEAERALSARVGGGCNVPFGALATLDYGTMVLRAVLATPDGRRLVRGEARGPASSAASLVDRVADQLVQGEGRKILKEVL